MRAPNEEKASVALSGAVARATWLRAQLLDFQAPFWHAADAVRLATKHVGEIPVDANGQTHHHSFRATGQRIWPGLVAAKLSLINEELELPRMQGLCCLPYFSC